MPKRIALIADAFPPMRTSAAVQLRDLSLELANQGYQVVVLMPSSDLKTAWEINTLGAVQVLKLKAPKTKDIGYIQRTLNEFLMPFYMRMNLSKSPFSHVKWDGLVWYAPSIFLSPLVKYLKKKSNCKSYLILRDIFPEWAVDMGTLSKGLPYRFFKIIEKYQYSVADTIGVQTSGNLSYLEDWGSQPQKKLEVLQNWLAKSSDVGCSISIENSPLAGRTIFVYAGNMGIAQGMGILLDLAEQLHSRNDVGFLFVGRGSDAQKLQQMAKDKNLNNVLFYEEIDPSEITGLYSQCHIGLVALDQRHKTHNIPGKFLSYMQNGLPVLACINHGNDLVNLIEENRLGKVCTDYKIESLVKKSLELLDDLEVDSGEISIRCFQTADDLFSTNSTVKQITSNLF